MRLVQYILKGKTTSHVGIRLGQGILDLKSVDPKYPTTLIQLLSEDEKNIENISKINLSDFQANYSLTEVDLLPPIRNQDKVVCVGMNYLDHCTEQNVPVPKEPIFFSKFPSNIIGPSDPIPYPAISKELDYEVELAVVIGKKGKDIPIEKAMDYVLGFTVAHDVSARDWQFQKNGGQWLISKAMDGFCPIGPEIVTLDELSNPHNLDIRCFVNGEIVQDSNTGQIVHKVDTIVSILSKFVTLLPGDIILTGTPPGVGCFKKPPKFLKKGDVVECEIQSIGRIRNQII